MYVDCFRLNIVEDFQEANGDLNIDFFHGLTSPQRLVTSCWFFVTLHDMELKAIPDIVMQFIDQLC